MFYFDISKSEVTKQKLRDFYMNWTYEKLSTFTYH